ncbi:MAG: protein phosphatase 2C domain-containing protein [Gemmataceae bacterium]|nr:protein phosphatase 2C domain-containing protein [Gemmataceae bacterium]
MSVRVQCPHCRGVCQVEPQQFGSTVSCGQCGRLFGLPPAPASSAPPAQAAQPAPPSRGGIWGGLRGLYRAITGPATSSTSAGTPSARPPSEEDIQIELDGPAAAALASTGPPIPAQALPPGNCRLDIGSATSCGLARPRNEDSCLVVQFTATNLDQRRDVALVIVADGMGGYEAGDQASALTTRTVAGGLLAQLTLVVAVHAQEAPPGGLAEQILQALRNANRLVYEKAQKDPACKGMGATAAVVVAWEGRVLIGHVGDCRVYHHRGGKLTQVTRDQTLVARMVEMGTLTAQEALTHPNRNEVTQAVGKSADIYPAQHELTAARGDWLIVACDGLHAHVSARALEEALGQVVPSAAELANYLVELANEGGGSDNCTVVAIRCY